MKVRHDVQALIFDEENGKKKIFLIKFYDPTKKRYTWRLVKGGVEKNETEEQALKREIEEEVSLKDVEIIKKIYNYEFTFMDTKHKVSTYLVKGRMSEKPTLNWDGNRKIVECGWFYPQQALKLLFWESEKEAIRAFEKFFTKQSK